MADRHLRIGLAILALSTGSFFRTAQAADWKIVPDVHAAETYTDNLTLANRKSGDFISEVTPGIALQETGSRSRATVDYSLQGLFYQRQSRLDHAYSHLDAAGEAELVEKSLFLNAGASIAQQPISLTAATGMNNSNPTGNIVDVSTWSIGPYLKHRFGSTATGEARFTHQTQSYGTGGPSSAGSANIGALSNSTSDNTALSLKSGSAFNNLLWGMNYNDSNIRYTGRPDSKLSNYSASIGYLFTPKFKIMLLGGYERNSYVYIGSKPQGTYWNTEISWAPSTHTKLSASAGQRYFGKTGSLTLSHVTRLTTLEAAYNQDVTTSALQQSIPPSTVLDQLLKAQIPDNGARQQAVQSMLASLGAQPSLLGQSITTNQIYLNKRFTATMGIDLPKSLVVLTAFESRSSTLEQGNSFLPGTVNYGAVNQRGATASWDWQVSPKLSSNASASLTTSDFPGQSDKRKQFLLGLTRKFAHGLSGNVSYRHQAFDAAAPSNYEENAIIASLNYRH